MKWMVNGIVVDEAELRRLNLPIAGDCITKQCGNDKTKGDGKFLPPPTYKGLYEEAVQRLNKVWEESHKSNVKHLEIMTKLLKDMEEKKTKRMTKAEAFEYLKGKKVYVNSHSAHIQATLFEAGYTWSSGSRNIDNEDMPFLLTTNHGEFFTICNMREFAKVAYEEISADDILSIEIVDDKKDDKRKSEILDEIAKLGEKISDLIEEYDGDIIIEIDQYEVLLRNSGDILYRK